MRAILNDKPSHPPRRERAQEAMRHAMVEWGERLRAPLMLSPALAVILLLFVGGFIMGLLQSFEYMPIIGKSNFSAQSYINIITDSEFKQSLLLTVWIAVSSTILSSVLAIACALVLRERFPGKRCANFFFQLVITTPHLVGAVGILFLLSQSGLLARVVYLLGVIKESAQFPELVYDKYAVGIIAEYLWKTTCFTGVNVLSILQSLGEDYEDLARTLGATRWQRFRYVILPMIMPGLLSCSILIFAFTFGSYATPALLGRSYPATLPVLAYLKYVDIDLNARPEAMAMSVIIAAMITVLVSVYARVAHRVIRRD